MSVGIAIGLSGDRIATSSLQSTAQGQDRMDKNQTQTCQVQRKSEREGCVHRFISFVSFPAFTPSSRQLQHRVFFCLHSLAHFQTRSRRPPKAINLE